VQSIMNERHGPTEITVYGQEQLPFILWLFFFYADGLKSHHRRRWFWYIQIL
jgi:hypothetical protein